MTTTIITSCYSTGKRRLHRCFPLRTRLRMSTECVRSRMSPKRLSLVFPRRICLPSHLIHGILGPVSSHPKWHLDRFGRFSTAADCHQQTDTYRHTDRTPRILNPRVTNSPVNSSNSACRCRGSISSSSSSSSRLGGRSSDDEVFKNSGRSDDDGGCRPRTSDHGSAGVADGRRPDYRRRRRLRREAATGHHPAQQPQVRASLELLSRKSLVRERKLEERGSQNIEAKYRS